MILRHVQLVDWDNSEQWGKCRTSLYDSKIYDSSTIGSFDECRHSTVGGHRPSDATHVGCTVECRHIGPSEWNVQGGPKK